MSTLITKRSLGLLGVAAVLIAVMVGLGLWQYRAYDDHQRNDAESVAEHDAIPLDDALGPDDGFGQGSVGQPVTVSGEYVGAEQFYVTGLEGASDEYSVVTPLVTSSGSAILVVRGSTGEPIAPVPAGPIEIEGSLQPSMATGSALDDRRVTDGIRTASLIGDFGEDLYSGYVVLTSDDPGAELSPVTPPLPDASRWAGIRNLIYALQWWLFAAFVAFMWWRIAHDQRADPPTDVG